MYDELYSDENMSVLVPTYIDDPVLRTSSDEDSELEESEGSVDSEETSIDYSSALNDVNSNLIQISEQIDNLNENIVTLNDNLIFAIGLICALVFFSVLKFAWFILNNLLGLGKA